MGPRRAEIDGRAEQAGLRLLLRLQLPRPGARVLPDHLWRNDQRVELDGKTYSHDLIAEEALDWVRANREQPFFLYLPFTIPHANIQVPDLGPYAEEEWPADIRPSPP